MFFVNAFLFTGSSVQMLADFKATDITVHDEVSQAFLFHTPVCIYLIVEVRLRLQFRCMQTSGSFQSAAFCGVMRELQVKL